MKTTLPRVLCWLVLLGCSATFAQAQPSSKRLIALDISAQPLGDALAEFGKQADLTMVFYDQDLGKGLNAKALAGTFTAEDALGQLLSNTGLRYEYLDAKTVAILSKAAASGAALYKENARSSSSSPGDDLRLVRSTQDTKAAAEAAVKGAGKEGSTDNDAAGIQEIIVTAEKRRESIQDVAIGITAISGEVIEKFKVNDFEDYVSLVPGLTTNFAGPVSNRGVRPIGLRGVQTVSSTVVNGQNTVGFYINDTPIPIGNPRLVDLERIEVLRGPQGTLYGSSSLAGTIKLVTKRPNLERVEGHMSAALSSVENAGEGYEVEGLINIPLSQRAALRVSAYAEDQSGYVDFVDIDVFGVPTGATASDVNSVTARGGRAALRFDFTDSLRMNASFMYSKRTMDSADFFTQGAPGLTVFGRFPMPKYDEFGLGDVNFEWALGPVTVVSTTSYFDSSNNEVGDITDTFSALLRPLPQIELRYTPYRNTNKELTHETRIVSNSDGAWQYVAGVFYTDRDEVSSTRLPAYGKTSILDVYPISADTLFRNRSPRERREMAAFGELSYRFTPHWTLAAGLRYFDFDFKTLDELFGPEVLVRGGSSAIRGAAKEDGFVPKLRLEYRPADGYLMYATAAKGFRMGGANFPLPTNLPDCAAQVQAVFGTPTLPSAFESDSLWSYELGAKTRWLNGRLTANAAVFQIDWKDTQVASGTLCNFSGAVLNVGAVESRGFEFELQAVPVRGVTLGVSASYIDAHVVERLQKPGATRVFAEAGTPMPDIPEWSAAAIGEYEFPLSMSWQGFVRADYRYQTSRRAGFLFPSEKGSFGLGNLRIGTTDDRWTVSLYVENVTDEHPSLSGVPAVATLAGRGVDNTLRPRTYGVGVAREF